MHYDFRKKEFSSKLALITQQKEIIIDLGEGDVVTVEVKVGIIKVAGTVIRKLKPLTLTPTSLIDRLKICFYRVLAKS